MNDFYRSLFASPRLCVLLLTSTFLITLLSIIPAFYVIVVLDKYMSSGVTATLVSLTIGTIAVIGMEFAFRQNRAKICSLWLSSSTRKLFEEFKKFIKGKNIASDQFTKLVSGARFIDSVNKNMLSTYVLDWPFQLLLLLVLFAVSWTAGFIAVLFGLLIYALEKHQSITQFSDSTNQNIELALFSLLTVCVISIGANQVMSGTLPIGNLIGSNILAARFVQSSQKFFMAKKLMEKRNEEIRELDQYVHTSTTA